MRTRTWGRGAESRAEIMVVWVSSEETPQTSSGKFQKYSFYFTVEVAKDYGYINIVL
jgi:hypothetical protein